jgi:hypothetical protein
LVSCFCSERQKEVSLALSRKELVLVRSMVKCVESWQRGTVRKDEEQGSRRLKERCDDQKEISK